MAQSGEPSMFNGRQPRPVCCGMLPFMTLTNTTVVDDPVCGMDVETAGGRSEYQGKTYYFCGSKCKEIFDRNPEQYVGKAASTPKSGGCCS